MYKIALKFTGNQSNRLKIQTKCDNLQHADSFRWQATVNIDLIGNISARIEQRQWRTARKRFGQIIMNCIVRIIRSGKLMHRFELLHRLFGNFLIA